MKRLSLFLACVLISVPFFSQNNQKKFKGWKKAETEHFTFVYEDAQREAAEGFIKYADEAWNKIAKAFALPPDKTEVFVNGRINLENAFTYVTPVELGMYTLPVMSKDFLFRENWQKLFFTHELIHAAHFKFEDKTDFLSHLFGPYMKSLELIGVNGWAVEGVTTVLETELTKGGRGRSPYFEENYKAVTLDNAFLSYEDVGLEKQLPYSQSYVIGYLMMRSIADRYGLEALADIERNRPYMGSWEESVKFVTGETAQNIYRDVRIALAKRYADERKIPEGIIISPRERKTSYFVPAIVNKDGTLIVLRTAVGEDSAVVRLDPSAKYGRNYLEDTIPQKDLNTVYKETVLFNGSFTDLDCITADENGNIYATLQITRDERAPGFETENALYVWNEETGLKRFTKEVSLYQPSVSRNGKLLVAVEQHGMDLRLVQVDINSGKTSVLLEKPGLSFIQPAVNDDGTKVAFLILDDNRARLAVLDVSNPENYKIVANDDDKIFDPSEPSWNSDGKLLFTCNYRGRLESFELDITDLTSQPKPVVSDPIGVNWAYKTERGIYYSSISSSGYVIKMKPLEEWGNVPDFDGPSPAGEIIHFGDLESDYPDFKPYTVLSEIEDTSDSEELSENSSSKKSDEANEPVPVKGKKIKHRSKKNIEKAEKAESKITEIKDEKKYFAVPRPILYFPLVAGMRDRENKKNYVGFGGATIFNGPVLQQKTAGGSGFAYFTYFPEIKNFNAELKLFGLSIGHTSLDIEIGRTIGFQNYDKPFIEKNTITVGYTVPFLNRSQGKNKLYLAGLTYISGTLARTAEKPTPLIGDYDIGFNGFGGAGIEFYTENSLKRGNSQTFDFVLFGTAFCDRFISKPEIKFGAETEISYSFNTSNFNYGISLKGRYSPFTKRVCPENSSIKYSGKKLDCSEPVRIVPNLSITLPKALVLFDTRVYCEALLSGNPKDFSTFKFDRSLACGLEFCLDSGVSDISFGSSVLFDFDKAVSFDSVSFYYRAKIDWMRF